MANNYRIVGYRPTLNSAERDQLAPYLGNAPAYFLDSCEKDGIFPPGTLVRAGSQWYEVRLVTVGKRTQHKLIEIDPPAPEDYITSASMAVTIKSPYQTKRAAQLALF